MNKTFIATVAALLVSIGAAFAAGSGHSPPCGLTLANSNLNTMLPGASAGLVL